MIYSSVSSTAIKKTVEDFEKKFGIQVETVGGIRGGEVAQKLSAENRAGLFIVDVLMAGSSTALVSLKPGGLLGELEPLLLLPEVTDPKMWFGGSLPFTDKDHKTFRMIRSYNRYIMFNKDQVQKEEFPSYKDLLNPKWKGKIVADDPTGAGTGIGFLTLLNLVYGLDETKEFMRQFVAQQPVLTRERRLQGEWVAKGKYPVSVATNMETAIEFINLGAPLAFAKPKEGGYGSPGSGVLVVPPRSPHPNATKVFVNWILTREGHANFVNALGAPGTRIDSPKAGIPPLLFPDPDDKVYEDTEEAVLSRDELSKLAKEIFAPLLR